MVRKNLYQLLSVFAILCLFVVSYFYFFRVDLTVDKRFTIAPQTKSLMRKVEAPLDVVVYLDGDLNPGFLRLKNAAAEMVHELSVYSNATVNVRFVNPSSADSEADRQNVYAQLQDRGLLPTAVYERDDEGKSIQKIVFPWLEISYKSKTLAVGLLKNIKGYSGDENLNISIENLEFEITDAIRRLVNTSVNKIAFIEGHGELSEAETYDISKSISKYFQIDRGVLANDATVLDAYKAIIIAKPTLPFSESDKYIIDQYVMRGGSVLWLLEGVRVDAKNLSTIGLSPAMELDLNLNDQLFRYGVRINPVLLQDVQCAKVPVNIAPKGENPQFEPTPWFFAPILLTSPDHPVSRNIAEVRAEFCSNVDVVGENKRLKYNLLLATSDNTHVVGTPTTIDLSTLPNPKDESYFNTGYVPVAVSLEGVFESNFANRMAPKELINTLPILPESMPTRQIFIADGDIIRNESNGVASDSTTIPLGYDRYMQQQFGNKDFVLNALLYLADNEGWMQLRSRTLKMRMLNTKITASDRTFWQMVNVIIPIVLLLILGVVYQIVRKRKYTK